MRVTEFTNNQEVRQYAYLPAMQAYLTRGYISNSYKTHLICLTMRFIYKINASKYLIVKM